MATKWWAGCDRAKLSGRFWKTTPENRYLGFTSFRGPPVHFKIVSEPGRSTRFRSPAFKSQVASALNEPSIPHWGREDWLTVLLAVLRQVCHQALVDWRASGKNSFLRNLEDYEALWCYNSTLRGELKGSWSAALRKVVCWKAKDGDFNVDWRLPGSSQVALEWSFQRTFRPFFFFFTGLLA